MSVVRTAFVAGSMAGSMTVYAEAVERQLGVRKTRSLADGLVELREAIDAELAAQAPAPTAARR